MATLKELWNAAAGLLGTEELSRRYRAWITRLIRVTRTQKAALTPDAALDRDVAYILGDLNQRLGSRFQPTPHVRGLIQARLAAGYLPEDFVKVHQAQCALWQNDGLMSIYLRPSTLYRPSHFDEYLSNWYSQQAEKERTEQKRREAIKRTQAAQKTLEAAAAEASRQSTRLVAELSAVPWHSFTTWEDLVRHTSRFPDKASLDAYLDTAPPRIAQMRHAPMMFTKVVTGNTPAWAVEEFADLKKKHGEGSDA